MNKVRVWYLWLSSHLSSLPSHSLPFPPLSSPSLPSDLIRDLPAEALRASTLPQFTQHMRPYLWVKFPSATSAEINAAIQVWLHPGPRARSLLP